MENTPILCGDTLMLNVRMFMGQSLSPQRMTMQYGAYLKIMPRCPA